MIRISVLILYHNFRRRDFHIIIDVGNVPNIQASQVHDKKISNPNTITFHNLSKIYNNI